MGSEREKLGDVNLVSLTIGLAGAQLLVGPLEERVEEVVRHLAGRQKGCCDADGDGLAKHLFLVGDRPLACCLEDAVRQVLAVEQDVVAVRLIAIPCRSSARRRVRCDRERDELVACGPPRRDLGASHAQSQNVREPLHDEIPDGVTVGGVLVPPPEVVHVHHQHRDGAATLVSLETIKCVRNHRSGRPLSEQLGPLVQDCPAVDPHQHALTDGRRGHATQLRHVCRTGVDPSRLDRPVGVGE